MFTRTSNHAKSGQLAQVNIAVSDSLLAAAVACSLCLLMLLLPLQVCTLQ